MKSNGELSPILAVAKEILAEAKSELHVNDIAARAVSKNKNMGMLEEAFASKLSSALSAHLNTLKPIFAKPLNKQGAPRRGVYRLKQNRTPSLIGSIEPPPAITLFIGKAGEYAVMSELLFWGYNVSLMSVDQGIDVVASKDGRYHHIQVKTTTASPSGESFSFQIQQKSFDANNNSSMWYVFAMRTKQKTNYAIIPSHHIHNLRNIGVIGGKDLSIQITEADKGRRFMLNGRDDISLRINNFGVIN